jgi:DNA-binding LytR/AlgR family response regulator
MAILKRDRTARCEAYQLTESRMPADDAGRKRQDVFPEEESHYALPAKMRTLIVDDQILERELLRRLLRGEPAVEIVGASTNGREAVEAIRILQPDLIFLDVQMPQLDGFGVIAEINQARPPFIVFVTSNENFALKAFDVHAVDYLLKPYGRQRFQQALLRARQQFHFRHLSGLWDARKRQSDTNLLNSYLNP